MNKKTSKKISKKSSKKTCCSSTKKDKKCVRKSDNKEFDIEKRRFSKAHFTLDKSHFVLIL